MANTANASERTPKRRAGDRWRRSNLLDTLRSSPAYGVATFLHMLLLVLLSFWTVAVHLKEEARPVEVRLVKTKPVVPPTAGVERDKAALNALLDSAQRDLDAMSETDTDDPFREAKSDTSGVQKTFGVAGGGKSGVGRGGIRDARGGASKASEGSVKGGLDWLARHRNKQGVWCVLPGNHLKTQAMPTTPGDIPRTGLALLCFLCAGHGPDQPGRYQRMLTTARDWLIGQVGPSGRFRRGSRNWHYNYEHAIGTLALAECLARKHSPELEAAVKRATGYIIKIQTQHGWRYGSGQTDTSVTSWMLLALKSAEHARVPVKAKVYKKIRTYLRLASRANGSMKYMIREARGSMAMDASGLFMRLVLGEKPTDPINRAAAARVSRARLKISRGAVHNFYGIYYAALAMYQVGGKDWQKFNVAVRDGVVATQRKGKGCERGSWAGAYYTPDRVLATCFGTLTLETYYRYLPVHMGSKSAVARITTEVSEGERLLSLATVALHDARQAKDKGAYLAAEAAYERALRAILKDPKAGWKLQNEARMRLVQVAALSQNPKHLAERVAQYMRALPAGKTPAQPVLRVQRLVRYQQVLELARKALDSAEAEPKAAAEKGLKAFEDYLQAQAKQTAWTDSRAEIDHMLAKAQELRSRVVFSGDPGRGIRETLAMVRQTPASGPITLVEQQLLVSLLVQASELFDRAAKQKRTQDLDQGELALSRVEGRQLTTRLTAKQRERMSPLLQRATLSHCVALLAFGHTRRAHVRARSFALRFYNSPLVAQAEAIERAALTQRVQAGVAGAHERKRLTRILVRYSKRNPRLPAPEALSLAHLLLKSGNHDEAAKHFLSALTSGRADLSSEAKLGLARVSLRRGKPTSALAHLAEIRGVEAQRLDVQLERCQVWRAQRNYQAALDEYIRLMRALKNDHPKQWWNVAEQAALTYVEARKIKTAREFLEGLRMQDRRFGGHEPQRQRFLDLMRRVDVMKD